VIKRCQKRLANIVRWMRHPWRRDYTCHKPAANRALLSEHCVPMNLCQRCLQSS
jgi:hypothetical protein